MIVKLCEELREAQGRALRLVRRRATTRLAMLLDLQQHLQVVRDAPAHEIYLPMLNGYATGQVLPVDGGGLVV